MYPQDIVKRYAEVCDNVDVIDAYIQTLEARVLKLNSDIKQMKKETSFWSRLKILFWR